MRFIVRAGTLVLFGGRSQTRSFCYVDDLLIGLQLLMESADDVTGPCNLGNPHEVKVRDIAELILQQTGSRSKIERRPLPQDDPKRRQPVIARAIELLSWRPSVTLDKGLRATIDYFSLKIFTRQYLAVAATSPVRLHGNGRALGKRR